MSDAQERFFERLRLAAQDDFGTAYRPGLGYLLADSNASPEDMQRIGTFVRALDAQKVSRLQRLSGALSSTTGQDGDLLDAVGAGTEKIAVANHDAVTSADTDLPWWQDVGNWVAKTMYGIDPTTVDPQDPQLSAALTAPGGRLMEEIFGIIGKVPGFIYRANQFNPGSPGAAANLLGNLDERTSEMQAQGYSPGSAWDTLAFTWSQGESTYRDLSGVREQYGDADVDLALEIYRTGWRSEDTLKNYQIDLENQYTDAYNAQDPARMAEIQAKIQRINDQAFVDGAYEAVDRKHISPGRDLANALLPEDAEDSKAFTAISGPSDALFTLLVDPTLVGGKAVKTVQMARWGMESLTGEKVYTRLGIDAVTGQDITSGVYAVGKNARRAGVERLIDSAAQWRAANAEGDLNKAAALYEEASIRHRDLFPLWDTINGVRPAITKEERALARSQGFEKYVDANGVENFYGAVRMAPIENIHQFAEYAAETSAFTRLTNGLAANPRPLMPGKVGYWADKKATRAFDRTMKGTAQDEARAQRWADKGIEMSDRNLSGIIGDEAQDLAEKAYLLRGQQLYAEAEQQLGLARKYRQKLDATARRLSTFAPEARTVSLHSGADAKIIGQWARIYLPKYEASRFASLWAGGTNATRRALLRGLMLETFEASGLMRTIPGREYAEQWIKDFEGQQLRRYGYNDTDLIRSKYDGDVRAGFYPNQMQESVTLPAFSDLRRTAAYSAILGHDPTLAKFGLNAKSAKALVMGKGNKVPRLGTSALRYMLFNSAVSGRILQAMKLGWIANPANMLRNAGDEQALLAITGQYGRLGVGRAVLRKAGMKANLTESDNAIRNFLRGIRPNLMGRDITDEDVAFYKAVMHEDEIPAEVREYLGGRYIDNVDERTGLDHDYAQEAHNRGVPLERFKLEGFDEEPRAGFADGGAGLKDLRREYMIKFTGRTPATDTLAWIMWRKAIDDPAFLASLDKRTLTKLQEFYPDASLGGELADVPVVHLDDVLANAIRHERDKNGHFQVSYSARVKDGKLQVRRREENGDGLTTTDTWHAPEFIYRVVSKDDFDRMRTSGVLNTDGRYNTHDQGSAMLGSIEPDGPLKYGEWGKQSVLLKIKYRAEDGWRKDHQDGNEWYVATDKELPLSRLESATPYVQRAREKRDFPEGSPVSVLDGKAAVTPRAPEVEDLAQRLRLPEFEHLRRDSEHYNVDKAGQRIDPNDTDGLELAIRRMPEKYLTDVAALVTGRNGQIDPKLATNLLHGDVPSLAQLRSYGDEALPPKVIKAQYGVPKEGPAGHILDGYTALLTRFYDGMVTKPVRYLVRTPLHADALVRAGRRLKPIRDMYVERHGWDPDVADEWMRTTANKHALRDVIKYVDNPKVASQFSAMSNGWWNFFRAQEDWIRRYARAIKQDPVALRKAQLAILGAEDAGFLDRDDQGNLILTYPGSGALIDGGAAVINFITGGETGNVQIPATRDLETRLVFLNPSLTNPWGYSATPMVSIPMRVITNLVPGGDLFDQQLDRMANGELGAGRSWFEQLMPTPILRAGQLGGDHDSAESVVGGAVFTAMQHMAYNGTLDKYGDTPDDRQRAIADLQQAVMNKLVMRQALAFGLPGAPSMPQVGDEGNEIADPAYQQAGIETLKEEFNQMVARMGPGAAYTLWAEIHPEAAIYMDATKTETAPGARTTSGINAVNYVLNNKDFFTGDYRAIAPYFMPEKPEDFDQSAWNTLVELGVRQYKDLDTAFIDLATANGITAYYKAADDYEAKIGAARLAGNDDEVARLTQEKADRLADIKARYPALDDWQDQGAARGLRRDDAVDRLEALVADPNTPPGIGAQLPGVADMVQTYRNYQALNGQLKGQRSNEAKAQRQQLRTAFHDTMKSIISDYPTLEDLYNGVFRGLVEEE